MNLFSIPSLQDNYIWVLVNDDNRCLIIDPGEAFPVLKILEEKKWYPEAIFLTHHHYDHVYGVMDLLLHFPNLIVYGPKEAQNYGIKKIVKDNENIFLFNRKFFVFSTPGHTLGHLCLFIYPYLFCGDTLFSGGCGRIFEGTTIQMYQSLKKINQLPESTLICSAHEYTFLNMKFAISIMPDDFDIVCYYKKVSKLQEKKQSTLPTTLKNERKINLFLRINDINLTKKQFKDLKSPEERFSWLRFQKDIF